MDNEKKPANIGVTIFIAVVALFLIGFSIKQQIDSKDKQAELKQEVVDAVKDSFIEPSKFVDYESLSELKKIDLVNNFTTYTPDAKVQDEYITEEIIREKGSLSKAYLYVEASLNGKPLTRWESIYMKMNGAGGHLFRKDSLAISNPDSNKTQLLFALNEIPYLNSVPYSEQRQPFHIDWFEFFRDKHSISFLTFISSLQPAKLEQVILYYDCVDPNLCQLSLK